MTKPRVEPSALAELGRMVFQCACCGKLFGNEGEHRVQFFAHIKLCPDHPHAKVVAENERLREEIKDLKRKLKGKS